MVLDEKMDNTFEVLCATMGQSDFSLIEKMNISSDAVFSNQCNHTSFEEVVFDGLHNAKMISTQTIGVGLNRNLGLFYSSADICLFADDDVVYFDDLEKNVLGEFDKHKRADIIIFHFNSDSEERRLKKYKKTHQIHRFSKKPWATFQIAFRRSEVIKNNILFTTLFGGGCKYPCGEDTQWIRTALKAGLTVFVSSRTIGSVSFQKSSWFNGYNQEYYYGQGAFWQSHSRFTKFLRFAYVYLRTKKESQLSRKEMFMWMRNGAKGFEKMLSFQEFCAKNKNCK